MSNDAVNELVDLLVRSKTMPYIGESVSQLDHALQAAHLARGARAPEHMIVAALLHDVGHLCAAADAPRMANLGISRHEEIGARYLEALGVDPAVVGLVAGHVDAKRYLVRTRPAYERALSDASRATLDHQGGPMSDEEVAA